MILIAKQELKAALGRCQLFDFTSNVDIIYSVKCNQAENGAIASHFSYT